MTDDTIPPFSFPAIHAKKVTAAFDGGRLTSNGGVMLLAMAERRLGLADNLARVFPDRRDPTRVVHSLVDMKEELGLDHFEGRSWQGLHRHALMTMIAYAFL
ncbi:transposase, partial [Bradyrhizobium japonicum]